MYRKKNPISSLKGNERIEDIFVVKIKKGVANIELKDKLSISVVER
ncbi:MAG: hypothetical protein HYX24_02075 [Candidatus Aenigmarchaeota archaeon]|nr:hypothetical protein [Candidatus Aenigmarchaeota archaeon]